MTLSPVSVFGSGAADARAWPMAGAPPATHAGLTLRVAKSLAEMEAPWRAFEAEAVASPYQRFDWVRAYCESMLGRHESPRVVAVHRQDGVLAMLWPLLVVRRHGMNVAVPVGGKHANLTLPLMRPDLVLGPDEAQDLMRAIGRALGVDLLVCRNAPVTYQGHANPTAPGGQPSPSHVYSLSLLPDADATLAAVSSSTARKKLRNKERGLAKFGHVDFVVAETEPEVDVILDAFWRQKKRRFDELGIPDPFAEQGAHTFVRGACLAGLSGSAPAIELGALRVDAEVVAVIGGASDGLRFSGMFISFETGSEISKFSLGEILVSQAIRRQCARGRKTFDLGVGEARYKRTFCNDVEHLVDNVVAVSLRGRAYGSLLALATEGKRRLKASPTAMRLLARVRRARSRGPVPSDD